MSNRTLPTPPAVKGMKDAMLLIELIKDVKRYEKLLKDLKSYSDKANQWYNDMVGTSDAEAYLKSVEEMATKTKMQAAKVLNDAEATKLANKTYVDNQLNELKQKTADLEVYEQEVNEKAECLKHELKQTTEQHEKTVEHLKEWETRLSHLETKLTEKEQLLDAKALKIKEANKVLGN